MRTILEIGGGITPYFIRYQVPWNPDDKYVCMDVSERNLAQSKVALSKLYAEGRPYPKVHEFILHDAVAVPLPDRSVDTVVLSNTLSAPIHYHWDDAGKSVKIKNQSSTIERPITGDVSEFDLFYRERKAVLDEVTRVLKPGGALHIYTDLIIYGQRSYERLLKDCMESELFDHCQDLEEQRRIDALNEEKLRSGEYCYCFNADLLPRCSVHRFTKK